MPPFVHLEVAIDNLFSLGLRRNDGDGAAFVEVGARPIGVKGFVGEQCAERGARDPPFDAGVVAVGNESEACEILKRREVRRFWSSDHHTRLHQKGPDKFCYRQRMSAIGRPPVHADGRVRRDLRRRKAGISSAPYN